LPAPSSIAPLASIGPAFGALLALATLASCAPTVTLGSACVRNSDCTAPYACLGARCREECEDHRDCAALGRCVVGDDGLGYCTLADDSCDAAHPCGENLACTGGACFDPCVGGSCPAGGVCNGTVCERPMSGTDAGADASMPTDAPVARTSCTSHEACGPGGGCGTVLGGQYACRTRCTTVADCGTSDSTVACVTVQSITGGDLDVCSQPCDVFSPVTGCLPGEACDVLEFATPSGANAVVLECRPIDPAMLEQDELCGDGSGDWDLSLCGAGFNCDGQGPGFTCQQICTSGGALGPPCPAGTACERYAANVRYADAQLGSCDPL
jgi:hypothetical protein